jgi:hypothetical protein
MVEAQFLNHEIYSLPGRLSLTLVLAKEGLNETREYSKSVAKQATSTTKHQGKKLYNSKEVMFSCKGCCSTVQEFFHPSIHLPIRLLVHPSLYSMRSKQLVKRHTQVFPHRKQLPWYKLACKLLLKSPGIYSVNVFFSCCTLLYLCIYCL